MTGLCVTRVDSGQYLVYAGSVQNVQTMIYVVFVTMVINTTSVIVFSELQHLVVTGNYFFDTLIHKKDSRVF